MLPRSHTNLTPQPKYWCKHCNTYVKDTPLERKQHENTGKHQGNLKRFLQTIQNDHAKNEREKDKAKSEVERLNRVVGSKTSTAIPSSTHPLASSKTSSSSTSLSAADQKRQWAQLAEMGISVPESARAEVAMVGGWQVMSRRTELDSESSAANDEKLNIGVKRRKYDDDEEKDAVEENEKTAARRGWGSATKSYPGKPGQMSEDLETLLSIPISKKSKASEESATDTRLSRETPESQAEIDVPKTEETVSNAASNVSDKQQGQEVNTTAQPHNFTIKHEPSGDDIGSANIEGDQKIVLPLFKKRKTRAIQSPGNAYG